MNVPVEPEYARQLHLLRKSLIDSLSRIQLTELAAGFPHEQVIPAATYAPWRADRGFAEMLSLVSEATLVDRYRLFELYSLSRRLRHEAGDILEVGVWRGGSGAVLGAGSGTSSGCKLWLADTFSGVPATSSGRDTLYRGGEHADTSVEQVRSILSRCGIENYELLIGKFPQDTGARIDQRRFKLVHIDVDTYESAADVFHWAWPRMIDGSVVVFDDYGFRGCEGVAAFVNELDGADQLVIHNLNGHAIVFKRPSSTSATTSAAGR